MQIIKHRRGTLAQVQLLNNDLSKVFDSEVIFAKGNLTVYSTQTTASTSLPYEVAFIGKNTGVTATTRYMPVTNYLEGPGLPNIGNTYGDAFDGILWRDTETSKFYVIQAQSVDDTLVIATSSHVEAGQSGIFTDAGPYYVTNNDLVVSGSFTVTQTITGDGSGIYNIPTSSIVNFSQSVNWLIQNSGLTGIFVQTGSYYATTNDLQITGSLRVQGDLVADRLIVSSSTVEFTQSYYQGSNYFGDSNADMHVFTGSLLITGSNLLGTAPAGGVFAYFVTGSQYQEIRFSDTIDGGSF